MKRTNSASLLNEICIISNGYPTNDNPEFAFIQPVARAMADAGIKCVVMCNQSITNAFLNKKKLRKKIWIDRTPKGNDVMVIQNKILTFSSKLPKINFFMNVFAYKNAVKKYRLSPDIAYGHFWGNAIQACKVFPNVPVVAVTGESTIWVDRDYSKKQLEHYIPQIKGVISVSSENLEKSRKLNLIGKNVKTIVLPNGVDKKEFFITDKQKTREKLGLPTNDIIACFVGTFSERKGVMRVIQAARSNPKIKLLLIGKGNDKIKCDEQILFAGPIQHNKIYLYLNAADMFVLPTQAEGCCNAIVEAMACGLPIISSALDFNKDILNENNSIMIDPMNNKEIIHAMNRIAGDEYLRLTMSKASQKMAKELSIDLRVNKIIEFLSVVKQDNNSFGDY